jgi:hypothetical protein
LAPIETDVKQFHFTPSFKIIEFPSDVPEIVLHQQRRFDRTPFATVSTPATPTTEITESRGAKFHYRAALNTQ